MSNSSLTSTLLSLFSSSPELPKKLEILLPISVEIKSDNSNTNHIETVQLSFNVFAKKEAFRSSLSVSLKSYVTVYSHEVFRN